MKNPITKQMVLAEQSGINPNQLVESVALFDAQGAPVSVGTGSANSKKIIYHALDNATAVSTPLESMSSVLYGVDWEAISNKYSDPDTTFWWFNGADHPGLGPVYPGTVMFDMKPNHLYVCDIMTTLFLSGPHVAADIGAFGENLGVYVRVGPTNADPGYTVTAPAEEDATYADASGIAPIDGETFLEKIKVERAQKNVYAKHVSILNTGPTPMTFSVAAGCWKPSGMTFSCGHARLLITEESITL